MKLYITLGALTLATVVVLLGIRMWRSAPPPSTTRTPPEGYMSLNQALNEVMSDMKKAHDDNDDPPTGCEHNIQVLSHFHDEGTAIWPCTKCGVLLRWDSELEIFVPSVCEKGSGLPTEIERANYIGGRLERLHQQMEDNQTPPENPGWPFPYLRSTRKAEGTKE